MFKLGGKSFLVHVYPRFRSGDDNACEISFDVHFDRWVHVRGFAGAEINANILTDEIESPAIIGTKQSVSVMVTPEEGSMFKR